MDKKYRLLKDLPGIPKGSTAYGQFPVTFCPSGGGKCFTFGEDEMINNPDWFEEVKDEKPEKIKKGTVMSWIGDEDFKVIYTGKGCSRNEFSGVVIGKGKDTLFKINDYGRTWLFIYFKPAQ